jgi:hypothetical protein
MLCCCWSECPRWLKKQARGGQLVLLVNPIIFMNFCEFNDEILKIRDFLLFLMFVKFEFLNYASD